jgi:hypothetical protein
VTKKCINAPNLSQVYIKFISKEIPNVIILWNVYLELSSNERL